MYQNLKDSVKVGEEQLGRLKKGTREWETANNELNNAKKFLNDMKNKYQFESLKRFDNF